MSRYFASTDSAVSDREIKNAKRVRDIAAESMVLLENNGVLPLDENVKKVALFGNGARRTVKGGTGSGDVNSRFVISIEEGFEKTGIEVTTKDWMDRYDSIVETEQSCYYRELQKYIETEGQLAILRVLDNPFQEPPVIPVTAEDLAPADAAIYVLARNSGEGCDRSPIPGQYELFEEEKEIIQILRSEYEKLIIVLNVGGVIDTKFLRMESGADAILLMGQVGNIGGEALVDVLFGKKYPSGHLTSTWAENYEDYPNANEFSHLGKTLDDSYYTEGIYVGYRYFDTFGVKPAYPFGYGKSYTSFEVVETSAILDETCMKTKVTVQNSGSEYSGKEVVQVYYSAPEGTLEKPYQELAAYEKTRTLKPGEKETLELTFPVEQMASYDENQACYVLEKGRYYIRVGVNSRATHVIAAIELDSDVITAQTSNQIGFCEAMELLSAKDAVSYTYDMEDTEKQNAIKLHLDSRKIATKYLKSDEGSKSSLTTEVIEVITADDVRNGNYSIDDLVAQLTVEELADLCVGTARGGFGGESVIGSASAACPGAAGDTTSNMLEQRNIKNMILADGPAGLRLTKEFEVDDTHYYQYCTAIPIAMNLAQTWNEYAIAVAGDIVGEEMEEFGVTVWLAPAMNIHRNPLCGRNFEYYSEDPYLTGTCASAETNSVQNHQGVGVSIKHFALNNQENRRMHNNVHATERTVREIYLKGFEIAVKRANPMSIMTSYNLINGVHAANHYGLLTNIARQEWGFEGFFVTDWGTTVTFEMETRKQFKYATSSAAECIRAGNDLIMPGAQSDIDEILKAVTDQTSENGLRVRDLQNCAKRLLRVILKV